MVGPSRVPGISNARPPAPPGPGSPGAGALRRRLHLVAAWLLVALAGCETGGGGGVDLILTGGRVWTGSDEAPWAEAVAIRGRRIVAVGTSEAVEEHRGSATRVVELEGGFVSPGFIDNHTHFERAGELLLGANLLDVADEESLVARVREAAERLPEGAWIVGGSWGAYEAWEEGAAGPAGDPSPDGELFTPQRAMIDSVTPAHPVLVSRWDGEVHLANALALESASVECTWEGVECGEDGAATGVLTSAAAERIRGRIPEKSSEQRLAEARVALADLRRYGVTTIHDNTSPRQFSVFQEVLDAGELTVRVYARPTLDRGDAMAELGLPRGFGSDWIRLGGFKGFVDGIMGASTAMFYEPFEHTGGFGRWREMMEPPGNMERLIREADAAGYWPQVHAIGDRAIDTLLTIYEQVMDRNGPRDDRRFRVIHAQHLRDDSVARRMAALGVIAEVQPYHAIDDMRWMEERIGSRIRWTYAFRTLHDAGVVLSFGSDWPGTQASWYPANPLEGIYAAVTRQTLTGEPEGGWIPEERIDVETALRAYTVNNAYAEGEEGRKGRIAPGMLADLVVLDRDPFEAPAPELKDIEVDLTVVDGRIVHEREGASP